MRMIPSVDRLRGVQSNAELRVARLLAQVSTNDPCAGLYSVHLPVHEYKRMAEVDFVIIWHDFVLAVEVKGGRLGRHDGVWTFTNRYGEVNEKREGPFDQARTAMFALQKRLEDRLPALDVAFGYLVITPDQDLGSDVEWEPEQHAGSRKMSIAGMERALDESRRYWRAKQRRAPRGNAYRELLSVLRPDFDRVQNLGGRTAELESAYVQLADRQYDVLIGAERNARIVCLGGAGSGKTLLAVETATRAAALGQDVLLTCRSPHLAVYLREILKGSGVPCLPLRDTGGRPAADVLVVDEAQDLMDVDSYFRLDDLVKGGWRDGSWRLFCDASNQTNVDGNFDKTTFDEILRDAFVIDLPFNCRNTTQVVRQTQLVTGADLGIARAGDGPPVYYERSKDDAETAVLLEAYLRRLRDDEVDLSTVCVITMRANCADSAATATHAFRSGRLVADASAHPPVGRARLVTAAEIKGLEAAHVCVVDVDEVRAADARSRLYVAMTRPRVSLWMALSDIAWAQLVTPLDGDQR